jgi:biopolymer transport protein ExbB/TolQ
LIHAGDLTGSLWRAGLCTAMGLAVAIPAYGAYHILSGKVAEILVDMERTVGDMLEGFARETRRADRRRE